MLSDPPPAIELALIREVGDEFLYEEISESINASEVMGSVKRVIKNLRGRRMAFTRQM